MVTVQQLLSTARQYIGVSEGSSAFKDIIDRYNRVSPRPMGYQLKYTDEWCDAFVTVIADEVGAQGIIGRECGVERHVGIFKQLGIWLGRDFPKAGDIVVFDWDGAGWADHIGFVDLVDNNQITTIEGNTNSRVGSNRFAWNDKRIKGYARPNYSVISELKMTIDEVANEVLVGKWGNGQLRMSQLIAAGYDANEVQSKVNDLLSETQPMLKYNGASLGDDVVATLLELATSYRILPSLLIAMLHFEGLWGNSNVARLDNNWGGMTWSETYVGNPKVQKRRGIARPASEGGHYIHYESVADFLEDWIYLLRDGGIYKVSGHRKFEEAVRGLFKVGGAKYNYAAIGFEEYFRRIVARLTAIQKSNPGILEFLDKESVDLIEDLAREVIQGKWGTLPERRTLLEKAGYDYELVQGRVNDLLRG